MDGVAKGGVVVVGHVGVGAQNILVLGILCAGIARGPCGRELVGSRFVLICEEGLEPPINKEFRICVFAKGEGDNRGAKELV